MKIGILLTLILFNLGQATGQSSQVVEEALFHHFKHTMEVGKKGLGLTGFTPMEQALYMDALWTLLEENSSEAMKVLEGINEFNLDLVQKLRVGILRLQYGGQKKLHDRVVAEIENALRSPLSNEKLVLNLSAHEKELLMMGHTELIELARMHPRYKETDAPSLLTDERVVKDLFNHVPSREGVTVYMFCRKNRLWPCLMAMRDIHGDVVRNEDGSLWAHKSLASSRRGLPSNVTNGDTPAGVWAINSVMPYADRQLAFGKFRRLIIEFIPQSANESRVRGLLPQSSLQENWWRPGIVARDVGRNLFRIHGTLKINKDPSSSWYPFLRTSGCIAQRENTYDGVTYQDQRDLMGQMMRAMEMEALYENEAKIKGVLYLIEIDNEQRPVIDEDLHSRGIL